MTYIHLINRFWDIDLEAQFSATEKSLYFALLHIANRLHWKKRELSLSNSRLLPLAGCSKSALIRARERLEQYNLIRFSPGNRNGTSARYRLIFEQSGTRDETDCETGNATPVETPCATGDETKPETPARRMTGTYLRQDQEKTREDKTRVFEKKSQKEFSCEQVLQKFNAICQSLPSVKTLSPKRRSQIKARTKLFKTLDDWEALFRQVNKSPFLTGKNRYNWQAGFDWLIKNDENPLKVIEGRYTSKFNHHNITELVRGPDYGEDTPVDDNRLVEELIASG